MSHTDSIDPAKAKAEATFKRRQEQAREGVIAMAEYLAGPEAMRAKTERLRALRLAEEAKLRLAEEASKAEEANKEAARPKAAKPAKAKRA